MPAIHENLKILRHTKGMTQSDVAEALFVTRQAVSHYESGRTQPDLDTLMRLAEVYQVDIHDVIYSGNRLVRLLKRVKLAIFILAAIIVLGALSQSALYWTANRFFQLIPPGQSSVMLTEENLQYWQTHLAMIHFAGAASYYTNTFILWLGCAVLLYPIAKVIHIIAWRKMFLFLIVLIAAIFTCTIPFALNDEIFSVYMYLFWPIWRGIPTILLFFLIMSVVKLIKAKNKYA